MATGPVASQGNHDNDLANEKQNDSQLENRDTARGGSSTTLLLALIEHRCRAKAKELLSNGQSPNDSSDVSDAEVQALAQRLFQETSAELLRAGIISSGPEGISSQAQSNMRARYNTQLDTALETLARRPHVRSHGIAPIKEQQTQGDLEQALKAVDSPDMPAVEDLGILANSFLTMTLDEPLHNATQLGRPLKQEIIVDATSQFRRDYLNLGVIGKGGFGQVYKVKDLTDLQEYAIKRIRIESGHSTSENYRRVLEEVRSHARLDQRNIARFLHCWIETASATSPYEMLGDNEISTSGHESTSEESYTASSMAQALDPTSMSGIDIVFGNDYSEGQDAFPEAAHSCDDENIDTVESKILGVVTRGRQLPESQCFLYIKQKLYPMTLRDYLLPVPEGVTDSSADAGQGEVYIRHCHHILPTINILLAVVDGLEHCHNHGIVHRDMKPANIFLQVHPTVDNTVSAREGFSLNIFDCAECMENHGQAVYVTPCIGDFGLAMVRGSEAVTPSSPQAESHGASDSRMQTAQIGTQLYCRPRSAFKPMDEQADFGLDIYSLGIIAIELIMRFDTAMERGLVLTGVGQGRYPELLERHPLAAGIKSMLRSRAEGQWGCSEVRQWLVEMKHSVARPPQRLIE